MNINEIFDLTKYAEAYDFISDKTNLMIKQVDVNKYQIIEIPKRTLEEEKEYIDSLSLTSADVERAIYKVKGIDFSDLILMLSEKPIDSLDIKALKIELKAKDFYRKNPYIDLIGNYLGFTSKQLDEFFLTKDFNKLKEN